MSSFQANDGMGVVRIKPLGAGSGGVESSANSSEPDLLQPVVYDVENNNIDIATSSGRSRRFKYPTKVIPPSDSQADMYAQYMPMRVDAFLEGFDVNIMAYGQTGSGKTHTMFGPPGIMTRAANADYGLEPTADYGLYPRGVLDIVNRVRELNDSGTTFNYVLVASAVEVGIFGKVDMFVQAESGGGEVDWNELETKHDQCGVQLDRVAEPKYLYGQTEVNLHDEDRNIYRTFAAIATRNTMGTGMNNSSSRTCCFAFLTLYCHDSNTDCVRKSTFQFVDLAGSERLKDAHNGNTNHRTNMHDANFMAGFCNNWCLMQLSRCVRELVQYRRQGSRGHFSFNSYLVDLVFMLSESLVGSAHTAIFVCLSQAPRNNMQSSVALDFGEVFSKLSIRPSANKWKKKAKLKLQAAATLTGAKAALGNAERSSGGGARNKHVPKRRAQIVMSRQLLNVLKQFG